MKWIPPQVLWSFSPFFLFVHLFSHLFPMKKVHHQPGPGPSLPSRSIAWIIAIRATTRRISRLPRRCSVHPRRGSGALRRMGPWVHGPSRFGSFGGFHLNLGVPKKKRGMVYFMENLPWKDGWELGVTQCVPWYSCFRKPLSGNFEQQKLSDGGRNDMELWSPGSYQGFKWAFQELMVRWAVFFDSLIVGLYVFYNQL